MTAKPVVLTTRPTNALLARYVESLILRPVLTKAVTNATLNFVQENVAQYLSGSSPAPYEKTGILPVDAIKANKKAFKLAAYGFFISAPLSHVLMTALQKAFAGKTSPRAKIAMIIASNLLVSPIQNTAYLASLAVINGANSLGAVIKFVKSALLGIMKISWTTSPVALVVAQKFLAPETWVPFFSFISFVLGTYVNTKVKKQQLAAKAKAQAKRDADEKSL